MGGLVRTSDQAARDRFANDLTRNFSVVASAGSGKTTAITQRVLSLARSRDAAEILPRLVVVTYANRAADEMQQRARQLMLDERLRDYVQTAFNRAFFGTIHSFCLKLLNEHGHYLGLPAPLDLLSDDDELWQEFVQGQTQIGLSLGEQNRRELFRFVQARDLMELARRAGSSLLRPPEMAECPKLNFTDVYAQADHGVRDTIERSQAELREWEKRLGADWEFLRWPVCFTSGNSRFTELLREKFSPLRKWVCGAAVCVAAEVQRAYREFRLERGLVTYPDQIALAVELLAHPVAGRRVREEEFVVILDEAQDTEPAQFSVLLETTRPTDANGVWMETRIDPPQPGRFCMVGDFQQSIYRDQADLVYYRRVHEAIVSDAGGEALEFSVTFRLDQKQLDFVNATFRDILNHGDGAVRFVELQPRPNILPGRVIRLPVGKDLLPEGKKLKDYQKARIEAEFLARWIKAAGPKKLCAASWREVAILCPRKAWLQTLAAALRREHLPVAVQSEREIKGDSPAYAWLTALCTIMADPLNGYEIVGVLREVFGVSDHDLAVFSESNKVRFRIDEVERAAGKVSSHLRTLAETRRNIEGLALFDAIALIIDQTQLRERLLLLPKEEFGDLSRELDVLLASAAKAEAGGMILADFARYLRDDFNTQRQARVAADEDAIQLITSHKAKGSEWQAVVVPFLGRELRINTPSYPHLVKSPQDGELLIALGKEDKPKQLKDAIDAAQAQALERLLYVATTRAQHTLVVVLDQEIFATTDGRLPRTAQLRRLIGGADTYSGQFDAQTSTLGECADEPEPVATSRADEAAPFAQLDAPAIEEAKQRADDFVHKINPSAYEPHVELVDDDAVPAIRSHSQPDNIATLYGRWWHTFFQTLDWSGGVAEADRHFDEQQQYSPRAERSAKEWQNVRRGLFVGETAAELREERALHHSELPFMWRSSRRAVIEGVIDLLLVNVDQRRCTLIDWKTNDERHADLLRARYLPQIAAYWKAVAEITGFDVNAALFSTALGQLLTYDRAELDGEWARLQALPPNELNAVVAGGVEAEI
jgi:ATP-dependent helicase/nuclease subunit A